MKASQTTRRRAPARVAPVAIHWQDRISVDPNVCHGQACIKGTRVMVSVVLDTLAEGDTPEQVAAGYHLTLEDVTAALLYAAALARDEFLPVAVGE